MKFSFFFITIALLYSTKVTVTAEKNDDVSLNSKIQSNKKKNFESLTNKIKHVIVLMLENRSFDHMLGFLKKQNKNINGCLPNEEGCSNSYLPNDPSSGTVTVDDTAVYVQVSPHHSIDWTSEQIYGIPKGTVPTPEDTPTMDGFIYSYADEFEGKTTPEALAQGAGVMKCFSPDHVPIMANLSMEYGVFDGWYASVPGPTMVNRAYAGSATSDGMGTNDDLRIAFGFPQKSMYKQLRDMGLDYRVYYQGMQAYMYPCTLQFLMCVW
jgi:phospholipase C